MDVVTAFLHPKIDQTDILMKLHDLGDLSEFGLTSQTRILLLKKALYAHHSSGTKKSIHSQNPSASDNPVQIQTSISRPQRQYCSMLIFRSSNCTKKLLLKKN